MNTTFVKNWFSVRASCLLICIGITNQIYSLEAADIVMPEDGFFLRQWHHTNTFKSSGRTSLGIGSPRAWTITQGSTNVLVAFIGSGIRPGPDFEGRIVPGYNFLEDNEDTFDYPTAAGSSIIELAAATGNNGYAGAGMDWNCRILPIRVIRTVHNNISTEDFAGSAWAKGVDYAVERGARVMDFPLTGGTTGLPEEGRLAVEAVQRAAQHGVIIVRRASYGSPKRFPGNIPGTIAVGPSNTLDHYFWPIPVTKSPDIDVISPAAELLVAGEMMGDPSYGGTGNRIQTGAFYATALVTGVCSLLVSLHPNITPEQARILLCAGADDQVNVLDTPGWDPYHGWGRLNAYATLLLATTRIDQRRVLEQGSVELSWVSPPNAPMKQPYLVEFADSVNGPWLVQPANFRYETERTFWTSGPDPTPGFYRVRIHLPEKPSLEEWAERWE
jgi:thermitase